MKRKTIEPAKAWGIVTETRCLPRAFENRGDAESLVSWYVYGKVIRVEIRPLSKKRKVTHGIRT